MGLTRSCLNSGREGLPFWVHFQTTDVHEPHHPVAPFAGLYISPARRDSFFDWLDRMWDFEGWLGEDEAPETVLGFYRWRLEQIGVDMDSKGKTGP